MNGSSLTTSTSRSQPVDARVAEKRGGHADYDDAVGERIDMQAGQGRTRLPSGFCMQSIIVGPSMCSRLSTHAGISLTGIRFSPDCAARR
jgi:hypothetical protein